MKKKKNSLFQDHIVVNILKPPLKHTLFLLKFIHVFIYFTSGLWWVFVPVYGLSLFAMRGCYSSLQWTCFSLGFSAWALGFKGFRSFSLWAQEFLLSGSRTRAQLLQLMGSAAQGHVGSSQTRDQLSVPCIVRQTQPLTTREALKASSYS